MEEPTIKKLFELSTYLRRKAQRETGCPCFAFALYECPDDRGLMIFRKGTAQPLLKVSVNTDKNRQQIYEEVSNKLKEIITSERAGACHCSAHSKLNEVQDEKK